MRSRLRREVIEKIAEILLRVSVISRFRQVPVVWGIDDVTPTPWALSTPDFLTDKMDSSPRAIYTSADFPR
jgi:hypothetical protein